MKKTLTIILMSNMLLACNSTIERAADGMERRAIKEYSEYVQDKADLVLHAHGVNNDLPSNYKIKNGVANLSIVYSKKIDPKTKMSVKESRDLLVTSALQFIDFINKNPDAKSTFDEFPFSMGRLRMSVVFEDEEQRLISNGGVCMARIIGDKIFYEGREVLEKTDSHLITKDFIVHQESCHDSIRLYERKF